MTRDELIAALERAEGPSRELDEAIAALYAPTDDPYLAAFENGRDYPDLYTRSIDAAMSLVPDTWTAWELRSRRRKTRFHAELTRLVGDTEELVDGNAATPALALTIAALKARET